MCYMLCEKCYDNNNEIILCQFLEYNGEDGDNEFIDKI